MAKAKSNTVPPWTYLGGTSRRYYNPITGQFLSREAYDRSYGSLKKRGFASFKHATASVAPELRKSRPARGRAGASRSRGGSTAFSGLQPLKGRQGRAVSIPFRAYYDAETGEFEDDVWDYQEGYIDAIARIRRNGKIASISMGVRLEGGPMGARDITIIPLTDKYSAPTFEQYLEALLESLQDLGGSDMQPEEEAISMLIHVHFFPEFFVKGPSRKMLRIIKRSTEKRNRKKK
jgi:hypothetical protein